MSLPDCVKIGGEAPSEFGFCPTDFFIPTVAQVGRFAGTFGLVAGCQWGDDSGYKIQFLDLTQVEKDIIRRDDRFGYIELPDTCKRLQDAISFRWFDDEEQNPIFTVAIQKVVGLIGELKND